MDNEALARLFRDDIGDLENPENLRAILDLRTAERQYAEMLNKYVQESQSKADIIGRLFRVQVDAELAIRMDGVSRVQSPIVMTRQ